jgi:hypothetical protein
MMQHLERSQLSRCLVLSICLLGVSCSGHKRVYPVSGKVLMDGKPAANAQVALHPLDEKAERVLPQGQAGPDGTFRLTSYRFEDGAPPGRYAVTVFWGVPSKWGDTYEKILVPGRYLKPETSGLTVDIPAQATELPPLELKRK